MQSLNFQQSIEGLMTRKRQSDNKLPMYGKYKAKHYRNGIFLAEYDAFNDINNVGKNMIFNVMFNGSTQSTLWYIGLIGNSGFSSLNVTDTAASHAGWTESTVYSQANRVTWTSGTAAAQTITNASPAIFDFTGSDTINGIFIIDNNTKGGTSGNMWSTALFTTAVPVINGDELKVTYTLNA